MPASLICVFWSKDFSLELLKAKNCLGKLFLDNGYSLVPVPPHNITGIILACLFFILFISFINTLFRFTALVDFYFLNIYSLKQ